MIKYAVLTPNLAQPGGAERTILSHLRYSDPARMQCTGVAILGHGGIDEALGREVLRYTTIHGDAPRGTWPRPVPSMANTDYPTLNDAVRHVCKDADVLLTWGWGSLAEMPGHIAGIGIPAVCVSHCSNAGVGAIAGMTHLAAVSKIACQYFITTPGAEAMPITVIPNGVEVDRICPRRGRAWQRANWGVDTNDKVLLFLGRQSWDKNPQASLYALAQLPASYKLIMIGNQAQAPDQPQQRVLQLIDELGIQDRVKCLPPIPYVGDALAGADCLLHLSLREADSLVVKEAFMAGLPVVHTPVGSIPDMEAEFGPVGWGVGFLSSERNEMSVDADDAAFKIAMATSDYSRAVTSKMRAIAWEHWTGSAMCERWANYLEGIITK